MTQHFRPPGVSQLAKCPGQAECRATEPARGRSRGTAGLRYSALRRGWTGRRQTVEGQGHEGRPHAVRNRPVQSTKRPRLADHASNAAPAGRNDIPHFTFRAATQADSKSNFESAWVLKKKDCPGVARRGSGSAAGCPGPFARRLGNSRATRRLVPGGRSCRYGRVPRASPRLRRHRQCRQRRGYRPEAPGVGHGTDGKQHWAVGLPPLLPAVAGEPHHGPWPVGTET